MSGICITLVQLHKALVCSSILLDSGSIQEVMGDQLITLRVSRGFAHKVEEFAQFLSETGLELGSNFASEKLGFDSVAFVADLFGTLLQQTRVKQADQECESSIVPKCVNKAIEDIPDKMVQASEKPQRRPRKRSRRKKKRSAKTARVEKVMRKVGAYSHVAVPARRHDNPRTFSVTHTRGDLSVNELSKFVGSSNVGRRGDNVERGNSVVNGGERLHH